MVSKVFKYTKRKHAKALFRKGTIRIGTLYEFRNQEKHGGRIGDDQEGKKTLFANVDQLTAAEDLPPLARKFIKFEAGTGRNIFFEELQFTENQHSTDHYIFCFSKEKKLELASEFGSDTCLEIFDIHGFLREITETLASRGAIIPILKDGYSYGPCVYTPREMPSEHDTGVHAAFLKDPSYESQKEWRAVWVPSSQEIRPLTISNKRLKHFLRKVPL